MRTPRAAVVLSVAVMAASAMPAAGDHTMILRRGGDVFNLNSVGSVSILLAATVFNGRGGLWGPWSLQWTVDPPDGAVLTDAGVGPPGRGFTQLRWIRGNGYQGSVTVTAKFWINTPSGRQHQTQASTSLIMTYPVCGVPPPDTPWNTCQVPDPCNVRWVSFGPFGAENRTATQRWDGATTHLKFTEVSGGGIVDMALQNTCGTGDPAWGWTEACHFIWENQYMLDGDPSGTQTQCQSYFPPRHSDMVAYTAAHELGHALGLDHNTMDPGSLMYVNTDAFSVCGVTAPTLGEIRPIERKYPNACPS